MSVASTSGPVPSQETDAASDRLVAPVHDASAPALPSAEALAEQPNLMAGPQPTTDETPASSGGLRDPLVDPFAEGDRPAPTAAPRRSRRKPAIAAMIALLLIGAAAGGWFLMRETDEDRYLSALASGGFKDQYATPDVALAAGKSFCADLDAGTEAQGFDYQKVAVAELCPVYESSFEVIPTEEQMAEEYTGLLRDEGLGGQFASDATAIAHAESVCRSLDEGGDQQGQEVDAVGVAVYCDEYEAGFKTLYPIDVKGTFDLMDSDPSIYYPSVEGLNNDCYGSGGYGDISQGTEVRITNSAGELLTTAHLSRGHGYPPVSCTFKFSFTVMDGESGGYQVEVGSRGSIHYSAADLKIPSAVSVSLGD